MTRQAMGLLLLSAVLAAASGCNVCRAIVYDPFGPNTLCDGRRCGAAPCGDACEPVCDEPCGPGSVRGRCGLRGAIVGPCGDCCAECGAPVCGGRCRIVRGPLSFVFALLTAGTYRGCGWGEAHSGCGERYWGDWYGDPPECSDPCDCRGNFTGGGPAFGDYGDVPGDIPNVYPEPDVGAPAGGCRTCGRGSYASQSYDAQRPAPYASGSQRYPAWYSTGAQRSPTQFASESPRYPSQYSSGGPRYPAQYGSGSRRYSSQGSPAPYSPGQYAPRLISTTDRVVKPATADEGPRLAQPLRKGVEQQ